MLLRIDVFSRNTIVRVFTYANDVIFIGREIRAFYFLISRQFY